MTAVISSDPEAAAIAERIKAALWDAIRRQEQPSPWDLVDLVDRLIGPKGRWYLRAALEQIVGESQLSLFPPPAPSLTRMRRDYIRSILATDDLEAALNGEAAPRHAVVSTIDALVQSATRYRSSAGFIEMLDFMANFRDYAPFNNMLVRVQNPACSFFATARDWERRFSRTVKEDAHPMLILAPKHPVMLVYALDDTDGQSLPSELQRFARFQGPWDAAWLKRAVENAARDAIRVDFKNLSTTNAGFAEVRFGEDAKCRVRIVVHSELDEPSRYGVLCHELAHIYLGHLGANEDGWWPGRASLTRAAIEFEAEAVAYVVTGRLGLAGSSSEYVSRYAQGGSVPTGVSLDLIAKVAGRLEQMAKESLPARPKKKSSRRGSITSGKEDDRS